MKRSGEILTFNATVAPVLNTFGQIAVPTGLFPGGLDAYLMLGVQFEFNQPVESGATRDIVLSRASKTAIPSLLDDDVMVKHTVRSVFVTSGLAYQDLTPIVSLPPSAIIVVESNFYLQFKTTAQATITTASVMAYFERVTLTESEKNSILSARLNNLLS